MSDRKGIYVEVIIDTDIDHLWRLTQQPELHQRWDLRFTRIHYLPRLSADDPQEFLYETRLGFGLSIKGTGQSIGQRNSPDDNITSSLKFATSDPKSLIAEGSGYWKYVPTAAGIRFFTWYDYEVRFGILGRTLDRFAFRPIMGWATAWSFDRLRLWAVDGQPPETSLALSLIHATSRIAIATIWLWHGLVPKLLYRNIDEQRMLLQAGLPLHLIPRIVPVFGAAEILFGLYILAAWHQRRLFLLNAVLMALALIAVAIQSPSYLQAAFNPVSLNLAVIGLSVIGWLASQNLPSSRNCHRTVPAEHP